MPAPPRAQPRLALAAAMALQTASLRHACDVSVHTTFSTGMVQAFAEEVVAWGPPRVRRAAPRTHPRRARRGLGRCGQRLGARDAVAAGVARDSRGDPAHPDRGDAAAGAGGSQRDAVRRRWRRMRRRSRSEHPPHTPWSMRNSSAYSRHSPFTGQSAQTRRARSTPTPSDGKNAPGAASRQRARSIHAGVWWSGRGRSSVRSSMLVKRRALRNGSRPPRGGRGATRSVWQTRPTRCGPVAGATTRVAPCPPWRRNLARPARRAGTRWPPGRPRRDAPVGWPRWRSTRTSSSSSPRKGT